MLAAFVVVLTVSVATIAWSGTDDYLLVMVTLVVSDAVVLPDRWACAVKLRKRRILSRPEHSSGRRASPDGGRFSAGFRDHG